MFEYPQYADMVGVTVKSMFGAFFTEKAHKDVFNDMIDAKVALNKGIYESTRGFIEVMNKTASTITTLKK